MKIRIYVDGSSGADGHGGAAAIVVGPRSVLRVSAYLPPTHERVTNQQAELCAAILGLRVLKGEGVEATIYTDSAYVMNAFLLGWIERWREEGWITSSGKKPVANRALWETLEGYVALHRIAWYKVKGHSGDYYNEQADSLAHRARVERSGKTTRRPRRRRG